MANVAFATRTWCPRDAVRADLAFIAQEKSPDPQNYREFGFGSRETNFCAPNLRYINYFWCLTTHLIKMFRECRPVEFSTYRMGADKIEQAFPLVRELRGDLTLEAWRDYARSYLALKPIDEGHRGIVVAEHAGYLRGLLSYDVLPELFGRKTMAVRDVIVPALPAGQPAARSLLEELFDICQAHRCGSIRIDLTKGMEWLAEEWSDPAGRVFRLPVTCFFSGSRKTAPQVPAPRRQQRPRLVSLNP